MATRADIKLPSASLERGPAFAVPASAFSAAGFQRWIEAETQLHAGTVRFRAGSVYVKDHVRGAAFSIPKSALGPAGFRRWAFSGNCPEYGKVHYIGGEIHVDLNAELVDKHARLKLEITQTIGNLIVEGNRGQVYPSGTLIVNEAADMANEPDASFCNWESLKAGRTRETDINGGDVGERVALAGSVDWVLEIVSPDSIRKDTVVLLDRYYRAGVREYWLIDARHGKPDFCVFVSGKTRFVAQPHRGAWIISRVFERRFSLQRRSHNGFWHWDLKVAR